MLIQIKRDCIDQTDIKFEAVCNAASRVSTDGKIYGPGEGPFLLTGSALLNLFVAGKVSVQKVFHPAVLSVLKILSKTNKVLISPDALPKQKYYIEIVGGVISGTHVPFRAMVCEPGKQKSFKLSGVKLVERVYSKTITVEKTFHPYTQFICDALTDSETEIFISCDGQNFHKAKSEVKND